MKERKPKTPNARTLPPKEHRLPDQGKCGEQKSRDLAGKTPGDRGMCEKQSTTQGSE